MQLKGLFVQIVDSGAGATLSTTSLEMVEDESVTHEVSLNTAPTANVVVTPATSSSAKATVSGALTFTSTNYSAPQEVTVTGVADGTATISHTVTSTDTTYNSLSVSNVTAKVLEPAKTFTLVAKDTGLSTATGTEGTGVELEVTLDALAPTGGLSMTVTHNIGSTTPSTLTVPVGKRRATLTVAIADNSDVSAAVVTHTVTLSASGWTPKRTGADKVVVSFSDDDGGEAFVAFAASGTTTAPTNAYTASVDENVTGGALSVPVTVSALPAEPVTFTVRVLPDSTATEGSDFTIATKTVTFATDATDTATTKNLTVTLADDDLVEPDETIRLGFAPARSPARTTGDLYARKPAGSLQAVVTIDSDDAPQDESVQQLARTAAAQFDDVDTDDYYAAAVGWMLANEITNGCSQDSFCADRPATRQHFVTFLWRAAGRPQPSQPGSEIFADVDAGGYADDAIGWAREQNITTGCGADDDGRPLFCSSHSATRAHIAAFLHRYIGADQEPADTFADVDADSYFAAAVAWMQAHGITTGCGADDDGRPLFCSSHHATRAQVAAFLYRIATTPESWGDDGGILRPDLQP